MAKKKAKRAAKGRGGRKSSSAKARGRAPGKKPAKKKPAAGPVPVSTGRGAGPEKIGAEVVRMIRANAGDNAIWNAWWSPKCESIEGGDTRMAWKGRKQIQAKSDWWNSDNEVVDGTVEGPYVGATGFGIKFRVQVRTKSTGETRWMEEVGVYTVENGKVTREEFMGLSPAAPGAGAPSIDLANAMA